MKIYIIIHENYESPGAIISWAEKNQHQISQIRLADGEQLPENCNEFDFLLILGGPHRSTVTLEECPHFNAQAEITLIKDAIAANKHVLGVCLGAQLIGEAYGDIAQLSPEMEIGAFDLTLTKAGQTDPLFADFPGSFPVGLWHKDMPGLNDNARILAYSAGCPRQIINYAPRVYGFQCHFELTQENVEARIDLKPHELTENANAPYVWSASEFSQHDYHAMNQLLFSFLDKFTAL